ncbi:conserved hypothetical protein, secreted [Beggiatoa sp. PS]|nr:conserved hypothetical protein, secreted [Beggiatoa sp. PS]
MPNHFQKLTLFGLIAAGLSLTSPFTYAEEKHPIDIKNEACLEKNQTTMGMIKCEDQAINLWDAELNRVYKALRSKLNTKAKAQLQTAQRQWMKYRDAEFATIDAIYSSMDGTIWRVVATGARTEIVKQRVLLLTGYLEDLSPK